MMAKKLLSATAFLTLLFSIFAINVSKVAAYTGDFSVSVYGNTNVTQNSASFHQMVATPIDGFPLGWDGASWHTTLTGLPPNATASDKANSEFDFIWDNGFPFKITTTSQTPVGTYNLTLTMTKHGISHSFTFPLNVSAVPAPLPRVGHPSSNPPLPGFANWEQQMTAMGRLHCDAATILGEGVWSGGTWFYDGQWVYYQIADYTGDRSFEACARFFDPTYRQYVIDNNGRIPGYYNFTRGFLEEYKRTGDPLARQALIANGTNSLNAYYGTPDVFLMRETAFVLNGWNDASAATEIDRNARAQSVDSLLSMFDQQFVAQTQPYVKPFMVGLAMESLIAHYNKTGDPRVPPAIKHACDWLWAHEWNVEAQGFRYTSIPSDEGDGGPTPGLNNLIAPAYAWLFMMTGDTTYRDRGDQAFAGSLPGAYLPIGKQFSENYRWSFDYIKWRSMAVRTAFDYDGDGRADLSVFRPSTGFWHVWNSNSSPASFSNIIFGQAGDLVTPGDFDGDTKTDWAVFRPSNSTWYRLNSSNGQIVSKQFGMSGDIPVPGDYDGDGKTDVAVFRPSNGTWYCLNSGDGRIVTTQFGITGDKPQSGDFDGDGKFDLAVFRPSTAGWYVLRSLDKTSYSTVFGAAGDVPAVADFDGDRKADISVYRPSNGFWYRLNSSNGQFVAERFGISEDVPVAADYDGDGRADLAVFRPSTGMWWINGSASGVSVRRYGTGGDVPIAAGR